MALKRTPSSAVRLVSWALLANVALWALCAVAMLLPLWGPEWLWGVESAIGEVAFVASVPLPLLLLFLLDVALLVRGPGVVRAVALIELVIIAGITAAGAWIALADVGPMLTAATAGGSVIFAVYAGPIMLALVTSVVALGAGWAVEPASPEPDHATVV
jgi:hypothetical protein